MAEKETQQRGIIIPGFAGLNERAAISNIPEGFFDKLDGLYPSRTGLLERLPGKTFLRQIGNPIIAIHQCFDTADNIIIQTENDVQVFTLDEILNRVPASSLNALERKEEENMSYALITDQRLSGTSAGSGPTINGYNQRTLQTFNSVGVAPNGSPDVFVTNTGSNTFQLNSGTYRFRIQSCFANTNTAINCGFKFYLRNITAGNLVALNSPSSSVFIGGASTNVNIWGLLQGQITISSPTTFDIVDRCAPSSGTAVPGNFRGLASAAGEAEVYLIVEILKTN